MNHSNTYFKKGVTLFVVCFILIALCFFNTLIMFAFNDKNLAQKIIFSENFNIPKDTIISSDSALESHNHSMDSLNHKSSDSVNFVWQWVDYNQTNQMISFKLNKVDLDKAFKNRVTFSGSGISDYNAGIYNSMYLHDRKLLSSLVTAFKNKIITSNFNSQEALDYVVSSIQYIGYTFICSNNIGQKCQDIAQVSSNCKNSDFANSGSFGCCDGVEPLAVYSPFEFAFKKTGDCDTKALFAYTLLKEIGFNNVYVLIGEVDQGGHSMLGVKLPNPPFNKLYVRDSDGQKVYAWEVTRDSHKLGENCWNVFNNWKISI